jgi:hypothetical protein
MRVYWQRFVVAAALAGLAGCSSTGTPSGAAPGGDATSAAAPASAASAGEADRKACEAISAARLKLASAFLEFSGRAEIYEKDELADLAKELLDDVNGAVKDLEKAVADTDDAVLKDAGTKFVAGLKETAAAAQAAGTDVEKVTAAADNAGAQAAEKVIIAHCLDI